jgi:hypothetical protein
MIQRLHKSMIPCLFVLVTAACGPQVDDDPGPGEEAADPDVAEGACGDDSCSRLCGEDQRACTKSLGIGGCIDDMCSPAPLDCVIESNPEDDCNAACASKGVVCAENGCDGATAFGYPGPAHLAIGYCGESTPSVQATVERIEGPCDAPLAFRGEGSFELYQCCCDDPEH